MQISIRQLVLIVVVSLVPLVNLLAEDKHVTFTLPMPAGAIKEGEEGSFPTPPEIQFPVICTVEKLASISPDAIVDNSNRMLFKIEKINQKLDVKIKGGIKGNMNHGEPFEGQYKILEHSYHVHAEKRDSRYPGEFTLSRDQGNAFGHGEKVLILKASYHSHASVGVAAGICNEM